MKVKVKKMFPPGHVRTPSYLRGKIGDVERDLGYFKNPEELAYGLNAHKQKLYRCLLYTSPSPRDRTRSRMPSSA